MSAINRRNFLTSTAAVGSATVLTSATSVIGADAVRGRTNPSGVSGYDYQLPNIKKGTRLLFQGDSITDMKWGRNQKDRNHYLGHSYVYLIASRLLTDAPQSELEFFNRGMSGHKVSDLLKRWQNDALDMNPDILSILVGVNDSGSVAPEEYEKGYRSLLEQSRKKNPKLMLVLLKPFVLASRGETRCKNVAAYGEIVGELAKEYKAVLIETQKIFDDASKDVPESHWIWDGVHPLPQGHELIARNWIQSVADALK